MVLVSSNFKWGLHADKIRYDNKRGAHKIIAVTAPLLQIMFLLKMGQLKLIIVYCLLVFLHKGLVSAPCFSISITP